MTLIAHISDLHVSDISFDEEIFMAAVAEINNLQHDNIDRGPYRYWLLQGV